MKEYKIYKIKGNYKKIINILNLKMDREKSVKYNVKNILHGSGFRIRTPVTYR